MGNNQFKAEAPPQRGQICVIVDNAYTAKEKIPKTVYGQGSKVKVLGSKDLLCSRPDAPRISCSLVQLPSGQMDVYFSNALKPIG
jgi:hypothetical protein